jgi:putative hydrolase of HD superfamily
MRNDRLDRQLAFLAELDRLKSVERMTRIAGGARRENSAEHSWHLAAMVALLAEYAPEGVDVGRVTRMLLVHDVVEIDAGDTFCFDDAANEDRDARERRAADRLFGLLPSDQAGELRALWDEFEDRSTPDARYAVALDRFQGMLQNRLNEGGTWIEHGVSRERVLERMAPIRDGAPDLWEVVLRVVNEALSPPTPR